MADESERKPTIHVVVGGEGALIRDLLAAHLDDDPEIEVSPDRGATPDRFRDTMRALSWARPVGLILDPTGTHWERAVDELRGDRERMGIVVITARPSYAKYRRWQRRGEGDVPRANSLLSFEDDVAALDRALRDTHANPDKQHVFWSDGPRHPFALARTEEGKSSRDVRAKEHLHATLVLEARGVPRRVAAQRLDVKPETLGERIGELKQLTHTKTDVQLGYQAAQLGLLDDIEELDLGE
jgi:hypothetical protein